MATVEIDESEYALLKQLSDLHSDLYSKNRRGYERLVKESYPDKKIETLESEVDPLLDPIKNQVKELSEWKQKITESARDMSDKETFERLRKSYGLTEEGVEAVKKLQKDRNISDPEAAIALWERQNPGRSAANDAYSEGGLAMLDSDDEFMKELHVNPDKAARKMAMNTFREFRANKEGA